MVFAKLTPTNGTLTMTRKQTRVPLQMQSFTAQQQTHLFTELSWMQTRAMKCEGGKTAYSLSTIQSVALVEETLHLGIF